MSWKEKAKEMGPAAVIFLSSQGSTVSGLVVGDPVLLKGMYAKKEQERIGCPMITTEGFFLLVIGKRVFRKLCSLEDKFKTDIITVTRMSPENDPAGKYEVLTSPDADMLKTLRAIKGHAYSQEALDEAIAEATAIMAK